MTLLFFVLSTKLEDYDEHFLIYPSNYRHYTLCIDLISTFVQLMVQNLRIMSSGSIILCTKLEDYDEDFLLVLQVQLWT